MTPQRLACLPLLAVVAAGVVPGTALAENAAVASCTAQFAAQPYAEESAECFYLAVRDARAQGRSDVGPRAAAVMERLLRTRAESPWLLFYLGSIRWSDRERAAELFRAARDRFASRGDAYGEVRAGYNRARLLEMMGRPSDAAAERDRAIETAARFEDPTVAALGTILQVDTLVQKREDLERARALLGEVEGNLFPGGPYGLRRDWLLLAGNVASELGRTVEARDRYERYRDLVRSANDRYAEPGAIYLLLGVRVEELNDMPEPGGRAEILALARECFAAAAAVRNAHTQALAGAVLALLGEGEEAGRAIDGCLAVARSDEERSYCLTARARHLAGKDLVQARSAIEEALELARRSKDPRAMAFARSEWLRASWALEPSDRAAEDAQAALDAIEVLRDLQTASASRAAMFTGWTDDYHWLAGHLLAEFAAAGDEALLDRAFTVAERMRARALIDVLEAAQAAPHPTAATTRLQEQLAATMGEIAQAQRRLFDSVPTAAGRAEAEAGLDRLELEETDLRGRIEAENPAFADLRRPTFATLAEVREALADDEALLAFQVAPSTDLRGQPDGGGWLVVVTRGGARAYRSLDRVELRPAVALFTGLFEERNGAEAGPAGHLARRLLGAALADLPPAVERLIIVPDDALHLLPFGALLQGAGGEPLAARFQISEVPSATLWLRWRREASPSAPVPALALAVPDLPYAAVADEPTARGVLRSAAAFGALRLPLLPLAGTEGRAVVERLRGGSVLRLGAEASEAFVKSADLGRFRILHFATHAITDGLNPARSAILLPRGGAREDGLLQMREIVDLHLAGQIVVLSSCRSASGELLRGEGVMGLARAFFQAGAHAVVASLWPLADDDAAALFDRFYRHLAAGESVAGALTAAQRDRIAAGAPAAAWAGVVALGDADLVPLPGGVPRRWGVAVMAVVALALLVAAAAALRFRRRR